MSIKHRLVTVLLGTYPARWRREYGGELKDLLLRQTIREDLPGVAGGHQRRMLAFHVAAVAVGQLGMHFFVGTVDSAGGELLNAAPRPLFSRSVEVKLDRCVR